MIPSKRIIAFFSLKTIAYFSQESGILFLFSSVAKPDLVE
jgi:hypothetical protein